MSFSSYTKAAPLALAALLPGAAIGAPVFTGDVPTDFFEPEVVLVDDPGDIDVGIPLSFPPGTISGNDMEDMQFFYDIGTDTLFIGLNTYVIAGDVDGDGDPGGTSAELGALGGTEFADFGNTEAFAVMLDLNEDSLYDVIVGVSASTDISGYSVATFTGTEFAPGFAFGAPLVSNAGSIFASPSASAPDLEFTISNFSSLLIGAGGTASSPFRALGFIGSFSDAGIGEDYIPGVGNPARICFDSDQDGVTTCDLDCDDADPDVFPGNNEVCDGLDNDCNGVIDDVGDSDGDGISDCDDTEECDGVDNDGDGSVDEGQPDSDGDGTCDDLDTEECDGADNDGDGAVDEGFDSDGDGIGDCLDTEECDGLDNDGDGNIDEGFDSDGDGVGDCFDTEECDGLDNDGDGNIDEGFDADSDGTADCFDTEECDGLDNDGDGNIDEGFDADGNGVADCFDSEACDGLDNDGDGSIDEGFDADGDGTADCFDTEECDGADNDGDGSVDEGFDADSDGTADCFDTEECDGLDNDGDASIDEGFDADSDGTADCFDTEECDGLDNDGDGSIDEGFDANGNGIGDCLELDEVCDGADNDGDGLVDEDSENVTGLSPLLGSFHDGGAPVYVISTDTSQATPLVTSGGDAALGVSGVTTSAYNPADGLLYMVTADNNDSLYTLNPSTGDTALVGALSGRATNIRGMDFANGNSAAFGFTPGSLYGVSIDAFPGCRPNCLFEINAATGQAIPRGGVAAGQVQALSFNPVTGALWAYDAGGKRLLTIEANGDTTVQANMPDSDQQNGTGIDTLFSLAHGCDGQLYGVDMAYGVLLLLDPAEPQAYWLGAYGDVQDDASGQQLQGLDSWADGTGLCACIEDFEFPPIPEPTPEPTPDPNATPAPEPTPAPPGAAPESCAVDYLVVTDWPISETERGFHAVVTVTNTGSTDIDGWNVAYTFGGDEAITSYWQAIVSQTGADVLVSNESYNGYLAAGASANFGYLGTFSVDGGIPASFDLNGVTCN